jgi:uncharacterized membrane protein
MTKNRLEAFSDGVFSVAATLLVLDIKLSEKEIHSNGELIVVIRNALPNILTFIYSFLVVGIFWVGHLRIFSLIKKINHYLLWTNIFYLLTIAIIPFAAALISKHPFLITAVIFYCVVLFICGIQHIILLNYLERQADLMEKDPDKASFRKSKAIALVGPVCYLLAALCCLVYVPISFLFIITALIFYIFLLPKFLKQPGK